MMNQASNYGFTRVFLTLALAFGWAVNAHAIPTVHAMSEITITSITGLDTGDFPEVYLDPFFSGSFDSPLIDEVGSGMASVLAVLGDPLQDPISQQTPIVQSATADGTVPVPEGSALADLLTDLVFSIVNDSDAERHVALRGGREGGSPRTPWEARFARSGTLAGRWATTPSRQRLWAAERRSRFQEGRS